MNAWPVPVEVQTNVLCKQPFTTTVLSLVNSCILAPVVSIVMSLAQHFWHAKKKRLDWIGLKRTRGKFIISYMRSFELLGLSESYYIFWNLGMIWIFKELPAKNINIFPKFISRSFLEYMLLSLIFFDTFGFLRKTDKSCASSSLNFQNYLTICRWLRERALRLRDRLSHVLPRGAGCIARDRHCSSSHAIVINACDGPTVNLKFAFAFALWKCWSYEHDRAKNTSMFARVPAHVSVLVAHPPTTAGVSIANACAPVVVISAGAQLWHATMFQMKRMCLLSSIIEARERIHP